MIKQTGTGLNSRSEANPFNEDGFLPLITAPMYSVIDESNYQVFLDNKIQVCLPRGEKYVGTKKDRVFISYSLKDFKEKHIDFYFARSEYPEYACIDTANGNMPELHNAIKKAKEIHGDNLIIMAGNVASVEAFIELAKTGVDYIRVGIGGGGGCNTTSNTGVGQENLEELVSSCYKAKYQYTKSFIPSHWFSIKKDLEQRINQELQRIKHNSVKGNRLFSLVEPDVLKSWIDQNNLLKVKIVADGISSYIKQCEVKYGFNDNGYAAINKLLFAGADLVMVGKLFAQCVESAGEKRYNGGVGNMSFKDACESLGIDYDENNFSLKKRLITTVKYSGMSTQEEQRKYKKEQLINVDIGFTSNIEKAIKDAIEEAKRNPDNFIPITRPSEGSVQWIPVRWTLDEWLNGSDKQDQYPYLMGWVNSVKSAMSYTDRTNLQ